MTEEFDAAMAESIANARDLTKDPIPGLSSNPDAMRRQLDKIDLRKRNSPEENLRIDLMLHDWLAGVESDHSLLDEGPWND